MRRLGWYMLIVGAWLVCCVLPGGCSRSAESTSGGGPGTASPSPAPEDLKRLNVLLVTLDTTRVDYLSCYDSSRGKLTPNMDAVADDGVRFEFAIAQAAATPMSHASILTGLNPYQHGVRVISAGAGYKLSSDIPTLATVLKGHGWTTSAFLSAYTVSEYYGFDHGFDTFDNGLTQDVNTILTEAEDGRHRWVRDNHQRRSDATTDKAVAWLRSTKQRPFFMWVHYWDPHDRKLLPPREILARYVKPQMGRRDRKRAIYRAEVYYMDLQFGRLIRALKNSGECDQTIIVIVADHGEGLGQHNWWTHRLLYQEDVHVPLIIRVPGWSAGKVIPQLARTTDIYPTILEALGVPVRTGIAGASLRGLVEGKPETPRLAYTEIINKYDLVSANVLRKRPKDDLLYCAMDRNWKLIYRYSYPDQSMLYNLADDPHERNNLYERYPPQVKRLKAILDEHHGYVTAPFGSERPDPEVLEALESLGYVGTADDEDEPNADVGAEEPTTQP